MMFHRTIIHLTFIVGFLSTLVSAAAQGGQNNSVTVDADQPAETLLTIVPAMSSIDTGSTDATTSSAQVALRRVRLPSTIEADIGFGIDALWSNSGSAISEAWEVVYQLRQKDGSIATELVSEYDLTTMLEISASTTDDEENDEQFWVGTDVTSGSYGLNVLVRDPAGQRAPLQLAITGRQSDGSYRLGEVTVVPSRTQNDPEATYKVYLPMVMSNFDPTVVVEEPEDGTVASLSAVTAEFGDAPDAAQVQATVQGNSRGYLITPQELATIKTKAAEGRSPYSSNVRELLNHSSMSSTSSWVSQSSISGSPRCSDGSQKDSSGNTIPKGPIYIIEGSRLAYAKMLAAHLTTSTSKAEGYARTTRTKILDLTDTVSWGGTAYNSDNQCILYLSWYIPHFIFAADLLESYPAIWTSTDKKAFRRWLAAEVFPKVAWASRARTNNWGSSGSYAAAIIADYLWDSGLSLNEFSPTRRTLTAGQAYYEHTLEQLSRMSTTITARDQKDSRCLPLKGIQPGGGIPDELRRASISNPTSLCSATYLPSNSGSYKSAIHYQMVHIEPLVGHAELALRRGDSRLYNTVASNGSGSLLRSMKFVIANPAQPSASYDWDVNLKSVLYISYRHYKDSAIKNRLHSSALRSGHIVSYGRLTHAFASGETISNPPTKPPAAR
jgi:hypothetical protein